KQFLAVGSDTVAIYDPAKNLWTNAKPKGPSPKGYDACGCHDTKRDRIYRNDGDGSKGEGLMAYDIGDNTWSHLKPTGTAPEPPGRRQTPRQLLGGTAPASTSLWPSTSRGRGQASTSTTRRTTPGRTRSRSRQTVPSSSSPPIRSSTGS